jgi:hypothetical protein
MYLTPAELQISTKSIIEANRLANKAEAEKEAKANILSSSKATHWIITQEVDRFYNKINYVDYGLSAGADVIHGTTADDPKPIIFDNEADYEKYKEENGI